MCGAHGRVTFIFTLRYIRNYETNGFIKKVCGVPRLPILRWHTLGPPRTLGLLAAAPTKAVCTYSLTLPTLWHRQFFQAWIRVSLLWLTRSPSDILPGQPECHIAYDLRLQSRTAARPGRPRQWQRCCPSRSRPAGPAASSWCSGTRGASDSDNAAKCSRNHGVKSIIVPVALALWHWHMLRVTDLDSSSCDSRLRLSESGHGLVPFPATALRLVARVQP
jgi:hypothetical protein